MSPNNRKVYAALAMAGLALALWIHTAVRGQSGAKPDPGACVDQDAREQLAVLRRALAERDALVGRLARAANASGGAPNAAERSTPPEAAPEPEELADRPEEAPSEARPERRRPRYTRFQTPDPAVTVTQKPDGTYDIRTTDPALAGSIMEITAVTASGEEDKVFIRIPQ